METDQSLADRLSRNHFLIDKIYVQAQLIAHKNPAVRESCVYYVKDEELLLLLAKDQSEEVRKHICYNDKLREIHIEALLKTPTTEVVEQLHHRYPKLVSPFIRPLLETEEEGFRAHIAQNFSMTPTWGGRHIERDPSYTKR